MIIAFTAPSFIRYSLRRVHITSNRGYITNGVYNNGASEVAHVKQTDMLSELPKR